METKNNRPACSRFHLRRCIRDVLTGPNPSCRASLLALSLAGLAVQPAGATHFPAEVELSSLLSANGGDGSVGMAVNGVDIADSMGDVVKAAGDVNGDGIGDVIMSSDSTSPGNRNDAGSTYIVFGMSQGLPPEFELSQLLLANGGDGSMGFVVNGIDAADRSGRSASAAGDINGDGFADIVIGAPDADPANMVRGGEPPTRVNAGESYVVFGTDQGIAAEFELSSLLPANGGTGSTGFILNGINSDDRAGTAVSSAGDVNADGIDDLIIGANGTNEAYLVFGSTLGFAAQFELSSLRAANGGDGSQGVVLDGASIAGAGTAVTAAGDVNGDGIDDVVVGAPFAHNANGVASGLCVVVFGRDTGFSAELDLSALHAANGGDGSAGFVINGISSSDQICRRLSAGTDLNGDGIDDVVLGSEEITAGGRNNAGQSYVVFGTDQGFAADLDLAALLAANGGDGSVGVAFNGIDPDDGSGRSASGTGDLNGDGIDDIIIGADYASPAGRPYAGESYVIFGTDQGFPPEFELSSLTVAGNGDGSAGFVLNGVAEDDYSGVGVNAAGDVNDDGVADLIIAAKDADPGGRIRAGQSYIIFGRAADTDGDGVADVNDNCTLIANPDQCDTNADGFGNVCDPDINNDNVVNTADLGLLKLAFYSSPGSGNWNPDADLNCSGVVNFIDLGTMKSLYFGPPGPAGVGAATR